MPKQKVHKGLRKRVRVTPRGKVVRKQAFRGHLMSSKSGSRRQALRRIIEVKGKLAQNLKRALCAE
ncbi:MAG: 50S ribosomal protein L35 [Phycisphaerae bacterium]|nr:50S ribosomal protein L35 [Phycisphaerae bacterium]